MTPAITTVTRANQKQIATLITFAFGVDPPARWMFPDLQDYLLNYPDFVTAYAGKALDHAGADCVEGFRGAALWLPPDVHPDEETIVTFVERTVAEVRKPELFQLLERMGTYEPTEPHWFLPLIGVDPVNQGQGLGSALMHHATLRCDRDKCLANLYSTNAKNIPLYQRHGFELLGTLQVGTCPPFFPMLRKPRRPGA